MNTLLIEIGAEEIPAGYIIPALDAFRENILSKGATEHPLELYRKFRGRGPNIDALLERSGLANVDNP